MLRITNKQDSTVEVLERRDGEEFLKAIKQNVDEFNELVMRLADCGYRVNVDAFGTYFNHNRVGRTDGLSVKIERVEKIEL